MPQLDFNLLTLAIGTGSLILLLAELREFGDSLDCPVYAALLPDQFGQSSAKIDRPLAAATH